jgi:hypothetical protein
MFESGKESEAISTGFESCARPRASTLSVFTRPTNTIMLTKVEPKLPSAFQQIALLTDLYLVCGDKSKGFDTIQECKHIVFNTMRDMNPEMDFTLLEANITIMLEIKQRQVLVNNPAAAADIKPACDDFLKELKASIKNLSLSSVKHGLTVTPKHIEPKAEPEIPVAKAVSEHPFLRHWETIFPGPKLNNDKFATLEGDGLFEMEPSR